jgi:hypothetical protein
MSYYFPQASISLRIRWEDFGTQNVDLQQIVKLDVLARRITVNINDYTQADTFNCEIDYKNFPFDPRCIRACGISIFLQDKKNIFKPDNSLNVIEPNPATDGTGNVIFMGFVDEETIEFDDEKRVVKFEGRDFTSILIDAKYLVGKPLDLGQTLDKLIDQLLHDKDPQTGNDILPSAHDLKVVNRTNTTLPVLKSFFPGFGQPLAGQRNTGKDDTYWEIIQDLVSRAGLIAFIELDKLVISTPRVLYDKSKAKQFVYGQNIKNLEIKRKLGRHKGFNVAVRCLDLNTKEVLTVRLPEEGTADWAKATGIPNTRVKVPVINPDGSQGTPKDAPAIAFRVANVNDRSKLIEIGEKIFEELSRQQLDGSFETHEMETPYKDGSDDKIFDLTQLRIGTPISIEIDQGDLQGISRVKDLATRIAYLEARGYERIIAQSFAIAMGQFTPVFYTKAASFTLDADTGFKLKVEFINFIDLDNKGIDFG